MNNAFEWKKVEQSAFGLSGKHCFAFWFVPRTARTFAAHEHCVLRLRGRSAQYRAQTARKSIAKSVLIEQRMFDLCIIYVYSCALCDEAAERERSVPSEAAGDARRNYIAARKIISLLSPRLQRFAAIRVRSDCR